MRFKKIGSIAMAAVIGISVLVGCAAGKSTAGEALFDFTKMTADLSQSFPTTTTTGRGAVLQFRAGHEEVPVAMREKAVLYSGNNHSDDLFMGITRN
jgi:hypothetical protein